MIPDPGSSTAYDRYAYVGNNPLKYSDPSGHYFTQPEDVIIGKDSTNGRVRLAASYLDHLYYNNEVGNRVAQLAKDNDGVNDPAPTTWGFKDDNANCTKFASTAYLESGAMLPSSEWNENSGDGSAWAKADNLYKHVQGYYEGVAVLTLDIASSEQIMSNDEIQEWFDYNGIPSGSLVFYDTDKQGYIYSHVAVTTGNNVYYNGILTPEITDMNGFVDGPSSILNTRTYNTNQKGDTVFPYKIVILVVEDWWGVP